jgi:hypothetical protein
VIEEPLVFKGELWPPVSRPYSFRSFKACRLLFKRVFPLLTSIFSLVFLRDIPRLAPQSY